MNWVIQKEHSVKALLSGAALLVLTAVSIPGTAAAAGPATGMEGVKAALEAANQKWVAAFGKGDAAGVAALYTDKAAMLPPGADIQQGREAIQAFVAAAIRSGLKNVTLQTAEVSKLGAAVREIGRVTYDVPGADQRPVKMEGKYVVIWKQVKGAWKLDTDIWNANK